VAEPETEKEKELRHVRARIGRDGSVWVCIDDLMGTMLEPAETEFEQRFRIAVLTFLEEIRDTVIYMMGGEN
jgi:hypothetical protein